VTGKRRPNREATRREFLRRFPASLAVTLAEALSLGFLRPQPPRPEDFPPDSPFAPRPPEEHGEKPSPTPGGERPSAPPPAS